MPKTPNELRNIFKDTLEDMMDKKEIQGYNISNSEMGSIHIAIRTYQQPKEINIDTITATAGFGPGHCKKCGIPTFGRYCGNCSNK